MSYILHRVMDLLLHIHITVYILNSVIYKIVAMINICITTLYKYIITQYVIGICSSV